MENPNQLTPSEIIALRGKPLCGDNVCISRSRYDELIRAEMEREILFHAYRLMNSFSMEPVLDAIFNPDFKHKCVTDADNKAGAGDAE